MVTDVSPTADLISITFNKDMDTRYHSVYISNWYSTRHWSDDRTLSLQLQDHPDFENYPHRPGKNILIKSTVRPYARCIDYSRL